jgi:hypothetical protein
MESLDGYSHHESERGCATPACKFSGNIYAKFLNDADQQPAKQKVAEEEIKEVVEYKVPENVPEWPLELELTPELEDLCRVFKLAEQDLNQGV